MPVAGLRLPYRAKEYRKSSTSKHENMTLLHLFICRWILSESPHTQWQLIQFALIRITHCSVVDLGCLSRISDPNFSIPERRVKKIPDPGSASKNLTILTKKISKLSEIGSGMFIPDLYLNFYASRIQGSKGTGSRIRSLNTAAMFRNTYMCREGFLFLPCNN